MARYTRKFIIEEVKMIAKALNRTPTRKEFTELAESKWSFWKLFNRKYNKLLEMAGLPQNHIVGARKKTFPKKRVTYDTALRKLNEIAAANPGQSVVWIVEKSGYARQTLNSLFGNMQTIATLIGADAATLNPKKANRYTKKELVQEIQALALQHPDIKAATTLMQYAKCSSNTYKKRLGNSEAIRKIMDDARQADQQARNRALAVRYPVKYRSAPAHIKWARKRSSYV